MANHFLSVATLGKNMIKLSGVHFSKVSVMTFNPECKYMLSVITPVYNGKRFIDLCLKNVIDQKCPGVEHIIVDGGSTDGTVEVIHKFATEYSHIRWVSEKDHGQSEAMNKGVGMANGSIIGFLNVDDYYESDVLNWVIAQFAGLPVPSLLVGNCNVWGDDGSLQWVNKPAHLNLRELLVADESKYPFPVNPSAYFYHRVLHDDVAQYDIEQQYTMDIDFILRALHFAHSTYVNKVLGNYRYIAGTKTYNDAQCGTGDTRFKELIAKHKNNMPWADKLCINCLTASRKLFKIFGG
jgi:glycosyltransferase involved in cell wall biosynthesis